MKVNYRTPTSRGRNALVANPQRMESLDGKRWATGRTVKGEGNAPRTYVPVEVWALKTRDEAGKVVIVETNRSRDEAAEWVGAEAE